MLQVFALSFVTKTLHVDSTFALAGLIVAELLAIPAILAFGRLADKVGRKPVLLSGAIFGIAFPLPMFALLGTRSPWLIGLALALGICLVQGMTSGPAGALLSELFPTRIRWSGIAISRPKSVVFISTLSTPARTRGIRSQSSKAARLRRRVTSSSAAPSI